MIKIAGSYLLAVVLLFGSISLNAQFAEHYEARAFWGASSIYNILPDKDGFLWFSTSNGLVRFDGSTLQRFGEHNGLPDNTVYKCYEDREGRIWPFLGNGAIAYIQGGRVWTKRDDTLLQSVPAFETYVNHMVQDKSGGYYATTHNRHLLYWNGKQSRDIALKDGQGFVASAERIDTNSARDERFIQFFGSRKIVCDRNTFKLYDRARLIWSLEDSALTRSTTDICLTNDDQLVITTFTGAFMIDLKTKTRKLLLPDIESAGCAVDFQGNIWICTPYDGVYRFHPALFAIHQHGIADSGRWIETSTAFVLLDKNGRLKTLNHSDRGVQLSTFPVLLSGHHVPLWVQGNKLAYFDPLKYEFVIKKAQRTLHKSRLLVKKVFAWADTLVTVEAQSIGLWKPPGNEYRNFGNSAPLTDKRITASIADSIRGYVYVIAGDQLIRFQLRNQKADLLIRDSSLRGAREMCLNDSGILIAATTPSVIVWDTGDRLIRKFRVPERITQLIPLPQATLLMRGTDDDYLVQSLSFQQAESIRYPFSLKNESLYSRGKGLLLCIGPGHITEVDWRQLNQRRLPVKLYLRRLSVNGKEYAQANLNLGEQPSMNIQLSIGMLNFSGGAFPLRYRVCTATDTGAWIRMQGSDLNISLLRIAPHKIQISLADQPVESGLLTLSLEAHPPFLKSRGFYLLCIVILLLLVTGGIFWDIRRRKRRYGMELEYLKLEHRSINALLNPHFLFNAISNIQGLINKSEKHLATEYLAVLSRLMRQNLENLKENLIPLDDELSLIERYISLQNLRFADCIQLHIENNLDSTFHILVPPLLIHTFVENAIMHGFRPPCKAFSIRIELKPIDDDYVCIVIQDNGVGYDPDRVTNRGQGNKSLGIRFNQKRLERLSHFFGLTQSISIRNLSNGQQGTQVDIILYRHLRKLQTS